MYRRLILFSAAILMSLGLYSQINIGFTNLNGFPSVISSGSSHNLSGYIRNSGTDTLFTGFDVKMSVNNGQVLSIQNNVALASPLAPGDSVYWSKGGHNFPGGQFAPGNNDVLIWPTRMQGPTAGESDSLLINMYFANSAAFSTKTLTGVVNQGIPLRLSIDITVDGENVGTKPNDEQILLMMTFNGSSPFELASDYNTYEPGQTVSFSIPGFNLESVLEDQNISFGQLEGALVEFWLEEKQGMPAVNRLQYPVWDLSTGIGTQMANELKIYPNPASNELRIVNPSQNQPVTMARIYNLSGQKLREIEGAVNRISLEDLAPGRYLVEIRTEAGGKTYPFIKE